MKLVQTILTQNPCYTAGRKITVKGLMLHSVGCPQPSASVFIKSWNSASYDRACVHGFIDGNDGTVYQTLPWDHRGWHSGGSANNTHIGIEMCEPANIRYTSGASFQCADLTTARAVARRTWESAVELFAMLCKEYDLDPLADGVIISHKEGCARGLASNHGDPEHLWNGLDMPTFTMDAFRAAVAGAMGSKGGTAESRPAKCCASAVVAVARKELGYHEKASNSGLDDNAANSGSANFTKYAAEIDSRYPNWYNGKKNGYAWCDVFVDWCFLTAFGYEKALELTCQPEKSAGAGCTYSLRYYKAKGRFFTSDPRAGDQIFFGTSVDNSTHTGIVEKVEGGKVCTIEGNTSDQVAQRSYTLGASNILGYGRPAYDAEESIAFSPANDYYRVRKTWTDSKTQKGAYKIFANAMKCADANPGYSVFDSSGNVVYTPASAQTNAVPFLVKVTVADLNIRCGPGTNYAATGNYTGKGVFTITEVRSGAGSDSGWGKLKSNARWISLDYAARIS